MLTNISPKDAYKIVKEWHIANGWKEHALIYLFQAEWERHEGRPVDLHDSIVYWSHYESLKEVMRDYPEDWEAFISDGYSFKVLAEIGDEEADANGQKLEYLIQD
tara:strand:- start:18774 stop:19088 length:315 start_codon:yes stop_codon:yes gene_type:complete